MFRLLISKTRSRSAMAFLLSGPGIAVRTRGPVGSLEMKAWSKWGVSCSVVAATVAAALLVEDMDRVVGRRPRVQKPDLAHEREVIVTCDSLLRLSEINARRDRKVIRQCLVKGLSTY